MLLLAVALVVPGCWGPPVSKRIDELLPDFSLPDVNPASDTWGQMVSPSDFEGEISAWYFGHST